MKKYLGLLLALAVISCKTKAVLAEGTANEAIASEKIIKGHYENTKNFTTLYIKSSARYKDEDQTQNVTAEIRIKKDEKILVSIRFLGITMAKALITPDAVKYYEKINGKFFEGDYRTLSQWLGSDLDFQRVQNLLVGQAMEDLEKARYKASIEDKMYKLETEASAGTQKTFYFEAENFLVKKQEILQPAKQRSLTVTYPNHTKYKEAILPSELIIEAIQKKGKTNINIDYNTVTFNEDLSFPYSVPDGYERIFID